jgi:hypothetical protein
MVLRSPIVSRGSVLTIGIKKLSAELAIFEKAREKVKAYYRPYQT